MSNVLTNSILKARFRPQNYLSVSSKLQQSIQPQTRPFTSSKVVMSFEKVFTENALPPAGPYTQAIKAHPFVFVSGQVPAKPDGTIIRGSMTEQTEASIANLKAILEASGTSIEKVVKVNVFLVDMKDFKEMNGIYEKHFAHKPARSCVAVHQLPLGVEVEIECTALL